MQKVKASGADAVFLGAILEENGAQLIKDKVAVLGPNDGRVKLLAPDGFAQQSRRPATSRSRSSCRTRVRLPRSCSRRSGPQDRAGTIEALFQTDVTDGIIGTFAITRTGDPTPAPISVLKAADTFKLDKAIVPPNRLIAAARGR